MESSLRTRPSQAPRGKAQRAPAKLAKPGAGVTPREKGQGRIDDKIKKRMSTRYAEISSPTQLSGVPAMPSFMNLIPAGQGLDTNAYEGIEDTRERDAERDNDRAAEDDKKLLESTEFDPAACELLFGDTIPLLRRLYFGIFRSQGKAGKFYGS
jgi:hypothetical protein